jgi:hypothetical protein
MLISLSFSEHDYPNRLPGFSKQCTSMICQDDSDDDVLMVQDTDPGLPPHARTHFLSEFVVSFETVTTFTTDCTAQVSRLVLRTPMTKKTSFLTCSPLCPTRVTRFCCLPFTCCSSGHFPEPQIPAALLYRLRLHSRTRKLQMRKDLTSTTQPTCVLRFKFCDCDCM